MQVSSDTYTRVYMSQFNYLYCYLLSVVVSEFYFDVYF